MSRRRVVVTGIGLTSPIGHDLPSAAAALREGRHGIVAMGENGEDVDVIRVHARRI